MKMAAEEGIARVKVVGVGGGGSNAVARMSKEKLFGVTYMCINTDAQALARNGAPGIRIGDQLTRGLGVGGDPDKGRQAAEESREELAESLKDADMVFIAAGEGGGTGTGAAPVVAELARNQGALTVAVVTRPFEWEGAMRRRRAEEGINRLRDKVDAILVIPNDALLSVCDRKVTISNAFKMADEVLGRSIEAIAEIIAIPGEINLDFADVRTVLSNAGTAVIGIGTGQGDTRAADAARSAITNPLLDASIEGAKGVLWNITGPADMTMTEVHAAADIIRQAVDSDANIFFGMNIDPSMESGVRVTLIGAGFPMKEAPVTPIEEARARIIKSSPVSHAAAEANLDIPPFLRRHAVTSGS
jgi:cell division protein FtsZ